MSMLSTHHTSVAVAVALCSSAFAQITAPPLAIEPVQPDWSVQRTSEYRPQRPMPHAMEQLRREAGLISGIIEHIEARRMLLGTSWLPVMDPRVLYINSGGTMFANPSQYAELPIELRTFDWQAWRYDSYAIYYPRRFSPVWAIRAADKLVQQLAANARAKTPSPALTPSNPDAITAYEDAMSKCLRGKHILLAHSDSFMLARLLAGQGAHVTFIMPYTEGLQAALQTDPRDSGVVAGHGMGDNIAPDGSLVVVPWLVPAAPGKPRGWAEDWQVAAALSAQVRTHGAIDAALVIEQGMSMPFQPTALPQPSASTLSDPRELPKQLAALSKLAAVPLLKENASLWWYALATDADSGATLDRLLPPTNPKEQPANAAHGTDDLVMQQIAKQLGWDAGNFPVDLAQVRARWQRLAPLSTAPD